MFVAHYRLGLVPEMPDDNTVRSVCNDDDDVKNPFFLSVLVGIITSVDLLSIVCLHTFFGRARGFDVSHSHLIKSLRYYPELKTLRSLDPDHCDIMYVLSVRQAKKSD